jgi:mannitol-1-phosphate/altronate dehydrogenase
VEIFENIEPLEEVFVGTNGIKYKHIYYAGLSNDSDELFINMNNKHQADEIGDIGWFKYDDAISKIRPHHKDRKKIMTVMYLFIINMIFKAMVSDGEDTNKEIESKDQKDQKVNDKEKAKTKTDSEKSDDSKNREPLGTFIRPTKKHQKLSYTLIKNSPKNKELFK